MKVYKNTSTGYGLAVVIVIAENTDHAQWLVRDKQYPYDNGPMFEPEKWEELKGIQPDYLQTEGKIISYNEYWE